MVVPSVSSGRATWKARDMMRLDVAVAVVAQRVDDALARDDADQLRSAHDGEILLQRVHAAKQRVGQRVGRGERGEVGEHDFAHVHGVDDRLEEDALILDLRADHDEKAGDDEPVDVQSHAADHDGEGNDLADARGGAACGGKPMGAGEVAAQQAAEVERIGGKQMQNAKACLHPDHAAHQVVGVTRGRASRCTSPPAPMNGGGQHQRGDAVDDRVR